MQPPFAHLTGVSKVLSGYTGGNGVRPTYEDYAEKGHLEVVEIHFDPAVITYQELLDVFWRNIDPTDPGGQFVDRGSQYGTAIYTHNAVQKKLAEQSKAELEKSHRFDKPIVTKILPATFFTPAEEYHQDYYKKSPFRYKLYRMNSGRDPFITQAWKEEKKQDKAGNPGQEMVKKKLNKMQVEVTQQCGTEPPFDNAYWNNKKEGIYVDIVSGKPLFSSKDKFDSGTGWPSFTKPLDPAEIIEKKDESLGMPRVEVRSKTGESHLGHVFPDGPKETTGLRYCINSAALKFIPREELEKQGYGRYKKLFEGK